MAPSGDVTAAPSVSCAHAPNHMTTAHRHTWRRHTPYMHEHEVEVFSPHFPLQRAVLQHDDGANMPGLSWGRSPAQQQHTGT